MAPKPQQKNAQSGIIKRIAKAIQGTNDDIYRSTYDSDPINRDSLDNIKNSINSSIKTIMDTGASNSGQPSMSKFYERLAIANPTIGNDADVNRNFESIFTDNEFMSTLTMNYLETRAIRAQDEEIDQIIKYMPKLEEAINTSKDNILSADSFSKDFLNLGDGLNSTGVSSTKMFDNNVDEFKENYELPELIEEIYLDIAKYGEVFMYRVPYDRAIERMLKDKHKYAQNIKLGINEAGAILYNDGVEVLKESFNVQTDKKDEYHINYDINISINKSCVIESFIDDERKNRILSKSIREQSLNEAFNQQYIKEQVLKEATKTNSNTYELDSVYDDNIDNQPLPKHNKFDNTIDSELKLSDDMYATDGFVDYNKSDNQLKQQKVNKMNGCVVRKLERHKVIPININKTCLGYYYFEYGVDEEIFDSASSGNFTGAINTLNGVNASSAMSALNDKNARETVLQKISADIANKIDDRFVNKNQNLKKEIYEILKFNETTGKGKIQNLNITFIPPEDIDHMYFKYNQKTGRGISDLALSLIPAKFWIAIYTTNVLAVLTRGNDKRVYYVKQTVDSNISKSLLKTINEIKKANFGIRQIETVNNMLNITGRFNDYIIPRGNDGQSPIDFEVMQGQQVEIKTELLSILEESAINPTGIPIEILQSRQSADYAIQYTMQNTKFLRFTYNRQGKFQKILEPFLTAVYNYEYMANIKVKVTLPPPLFINMTNTNQLITNSNECADNVTNILMADEQDELVKSKVSKNIKKYYLQSYLNMPIMQDIINKSRQEAAIEAAESDTGEGEQSQ